MNFGYRQGPEKSTETPRGSLREYKPTILSSVEEESPEGHYATAKDAVVGPEDAGLEYINVDLQDQDLPEELPSSNELPLPPPPKSILKGSKDGSNGSNGVANGYIADSDELVHPETDHYFQY